MDFKFQIGDRVSVKEDSSKNGDIKGIRQTHKDGFKEWYLVDLGAKYFQWYTGEELDSNHEFDSEFELGFNKLMMDIALSNKDYKECERLHKLIEEIEQGVKESKAIE